jgi:hypothetical protein
MVDQWINDLRSYLPPVAEVGLGFCAPSTHQKDDKGNQQHQAQATAANDRSAKVKTAAAEQENQNHNKE